MKLFRKNQKDGSKRSKKKRTRVIIIIIVAIVFFLLMKGCFGGEMTTMVTTTNATRGELQESISTNGTVAAEEVKVYFAPISGKLEQIYVAAGDAVSEGQVLISYDGAKLDSDLKQAALQQAKSDAGYNSAIADSAENKAKLAEANTNIPVLEQQIADNKAYLKGLQTKLNQNQRDTASALADESYNLNQKLARLQAELKAIDESDTDAIAQKQKQIAKVEEELAKNAYLQQIANSSDYVYKMEDEIARVQELIADYEAYKAEMESQKSGSKTGVMDFYDKISYEADKELADIAYAQAKEAYNQSKSGICAQFAGVVTEVGVVEGATVSEGMQLLTLESSEAVKVSVNASKHDVERLEVGQKAEIIISGQQYTGYVSKINRMATMNASNSAMVGVEVHIDQPDDKIILGVDAKLTINTHKAEDALLLPVEAINADRDGDFVYVVEEGIVVRKPVVCGISNSTHTVILEGITEQDQVILTYMGTLEEGMAVAVMPEM